MLRFRQDALPHAGVKTRTIQCVMAPPPLSAGGAQERASGAIRSLLLLLPPALAGPRANDRQMFAAFERDAESASAGAPPEEGRAMNEGPVAAALPPEKETFMPASAGTETPPSTLRAELRGNGNAA